MLVAAVVVVWHSLTHTQAGAFIANVRGYLYGYVFAGCYRAPQSLRIKPALASKSRLSLVCSTQWRTSKNRVDYLFALHALSHVLYTYVCMCFICISEYLMAFGLKRCSLENVSRSCKLVFIPVFELSVY